MAVDGSELVPIPISELINGSLVPVDMFVRLSEKKFILIAKAGSKVDKEQFQNFESRTVFYLWVRETEFKSIVQNNLAIAGIVVQNKKLQPKQKSYVLTQSSKSVFREMQNIGMNIDSYNHSKQIVEATISLAEIHDDFNDLFVGLKDCSDQILKHSLAVSCISVLIAGEMNWDSRSTMEKLALGALLHDIGKMALPPEILLKPKIKMTFEEVQLYEQHPFKSMQMLISLGIVPDDVISIVYEHHENAIGMGFPRRLRNLKIHPLARIVAIADEFTNLTVPIVGFGPAKTPKEALQIIEQTMGQPFNKECFKALAALVNRNELKKVG